MKIADVVEFDEWSFINLTPHDIRIKDSRTGEMIEIKRSGFVARLQEVILDAGNLRLNEHVIQLVEKQYQEVMVNGKPFIQFIKRHPDYDRIHCVIVSLACLGPLTKIVESAVKERKLKGILVLAPDTGPDSVIRDEKGRVIGVKRLQLVPSFISWVMT